MYICITWFQIPKTWSEVMHHKILIGKGVMHHWYYGRVWLTVSDAIINGTLTTVNIALQPVNNYSKYCIKMAYAAGTLEHILYGSLWRGDYVNECGAYKAAVESYLGTVMKSHFAPHIRTTWPRSRICRRTLALMLALKSLARTLIGHLFLTWVLLPTCRTFPVNTASYL